MGNTMFGAQLGNTKLLSLYFIQISHQLIEQSFSTGLKILPQKLTQKYAFKKKRRNN